MEQNTLIGSLLALLVGFVAGLMASGSLPVTSFAGNEKKEEVDPVVRELRGIKNAISDRNHPAVKELENIRDELTEIAEMKRDLQKIERHLDD